jgi:archaeosortase C (PEF-CTERM variant)
VLSLFMGATLEYGHGYTPLGVFLFLAAVALLSRVKIEAFQEVKPKLYALAGLLVIALDIAYNYQGIGRPGLATLDTMTFFLGASLIARSVDHKQARKLGTFGMYMSITFIALYVTFYKIFDQFIYSFDHYFVMLPSAYLINALGISTDVVSREVLRLSEDITVKIGGPCSGLYSMFMLISLVAGYSVAEDIKDARKVIPMMVIAAMVAYTANILRVSIIYVIGYVYGLDAMMVAHVHLGWMLFAVTSIIILYVLGRMNYIEIK